MALAALQAIENNVLDGVDADQRQPVGDRFAFGHLETRPGAEQSFAGEHTPAHLWNAKI